MFRAFSVRKAVSLALSVPMFIGGFIALSATGASAHHAEIAASGTCKGVVTFTARSWSTGAQGTNPKIGVYYSIAGGAFVAAAPDSGATIVSASGVKYEFNAANNYQFTDTFTIPNHNAAVSVVVKSKPLANWGNGVAPTGETTTTITVPAVCQQQTTTTVPKTTTTVPQTTTTVVKTTTTTVPQTTTTVPQTTTTVPKTTTTVPQTTTTVPQTTTTVPVLVTQPTTTTTLLTEVLSEQVEPAQAELAHTGSDTTPEALFGVALLLVGTFLVIISRPVQGAHFRR